jgi:hypothetical protein
MVWSIRPPKPTPVRAEEYQPRHGMFHMAWEDKQGRLPTPGANAFAYESLALAEFTPIGAGVIITEPLQSTAAGIFAGQAVPLQGIPLVSGGIGQATLFDPDSPTGFASNYPAQTSPLVTYNIPVAVPGVVAPNDPFPQRSAL